MDASLTHEDFFKQLNSTFTLQLDEANQLELQLVEVTEVQLSPRQEQFSITFRGPREVFLGQGMRPLENEALGSFDYFIVPIRQDEQGYYYEAVFNRIRKPDAQ